MGIDRLALAGPRFCVAAARTNAKPGGRGFATGVRASFLPEWGRVHLTWLERAWYSTSAWVWPLLPLAGLFCLVVQVRRAAYRGGVLLSHNLPVPVIVVGNLTVGGTGKTPLVIWLSQFLLGLGFQPGIVIRGYRGEASRWPLLVGQDSDPGEVGDEAVLLARRTRCPVMAGPQRTLSGQRLIERFGCDIIVSDDGLQHYPLSRDLEILVIDGQRRFGNGHCLPAGPLREPHSRLTEVDMRVCNGPGSSAREFEMRLVPDKLVNLRDPLTVKRLGDFQDERVAAVAGIGNPQRFFDLLREQAITATPYAYPDHYRFARTDMAHWRERPVIMTEKDAVKCEAFATEDLWYLEVRAELGAPFTHRLRRAVKEFKHDG